jgi:cathepsin D
VRGLDAFERNTGRPHSLVSKLRYSDNVRRTVGDETLDYQPGRWYGTITVGSPPQVFTGSSIISCGAAIELISRHTVQIDTGSSDFFVPGVSCDASCRGHKLYDPSQSSTAQDVGKPVNLTYAGGASASVEQYTDTVTLAGYMVSRNIACPADGLG